MAEQQDKTPTPAQDWRAAKLERFARVRWSLALITPEQQCHAKARSTGERCRCPAVLLEDGSRSRWCRIHFRGKGKRKSPISPARLTRRALWRALKAGQVPAHVAQLPEFRRAVTRHRSSLPHALPAAALLQAYQAGDHETFARVLAQIRAGQAQDTGQGRTG